MTLRAVLLVATGGAVGALARYALLVGLGRWAEGSALPVATWTANAVGCALLGLLLGTTEPGDARLLLGVGVLGAFTTFSTYSAETIVLWSAGRPGLAFANALGSVAVGLVCVAAGLAAGRALGA